MKDKQEPYNKITEVKCKYCGHQMHSDWNYPNILEQDTYKKSCEPDDVIQLSSIRYTCPECDAKVYLVHKQRVQSFDDELKDWVEPKPKITTHIVETINEIPEGISKYDHYYTRKGYYSFIFVNEDGETIYTRGQEMDKRCEDCIYFVPTRDLEYAKRNPMENGTPNGKCSKDFRLRNNCPIFDKGE